MNNYISLSSLAMDLKRAAMGYYRNSIDVAERFYLEALKRKNDIDSKSLSPYLINLLDEAEQITILEDNTQKAEKILTLSTLFKNAAVSLANSR